VCPGVRTTTLVRAQATEVTGVPFPCAYCRTYDCAFVVEITAWAWARWTLPLSSRWSTLIVSDCPSTTTVQVKFFPFFCSTDRGHPAPPTRTSLPYCFTVSVRIVRSALATFRSGVSLPPLHETASRAHAGTRRTTGRSRDTAASLRSGVVPAVYRAPFPRPGSGVRDGRRDHRFRPPTAPAALLHLA